VPAAVATTGAPVSQVGGGEDEQTGNRIHIPGLTCGDSRGVGRCDLISLHGVRIRHAVVRAQRVDMVMKSRAHDASKNLDGPPDMEASRSVPLAGAAAPVGVGGV
jgi:hypothetical protein